MEKKRLIRFHFVLKDPNGDTLESTRGKDPMVFVPGQGQLVDSLEGELVTMKKGDVKSIAIKAPIGKDQEEQLITLDVAKSQLPSQKLQVGDTFSPNVNPHSEPFKVIGIDGEKVTLQGKNPLGAAELTLDVEIVEDREASDEEIKSTLLFS